MAGTASGLVRITIHAGAEACLGDFAHYAYAK